MAADLTAAGKKGVVTNALYDFWAPARQYMAYHAGIRILSEAASASLASPLMVRPDQIQTSGAGLQPARAKLELSGAVGRRDVADRRHRRLSIDRL